jgi:propanol-preferring alcohol dehydrogenase
MVLDRPLRAEDRPLRAEERPAPEPGPGEIRVRVRACGVCHTDLHTVEGDLPLPRLPLVPGHQVVGVVDARGPGARRFREGDRVGIPWLRSACGACRYCRLERENLCESARFTGYHADGGYAEHAVALDEFVVPLEGPHGDAEAAPLLCAGIVGYRALRLSEARPGCRLGLFGFGASAHIVLQIAVHWGCESCVFSRSEEHLALARRLGAAWTGRTGEHPPGPLDSAIVFAPAGALVPEVLKALDRGGVVALAGIHMSPIPQLDYALLYHERTVRTVANATRRDAAELLALAGDIPIRTEVELFSLADANRALVHLKEGRMRGAGVLTL